MRQSLVAVLAVVGLAVSLNAEPPKDAPKGDQPAAPAEPAKPAEPKKWEIPADAKPVERKELEGGLIVEDFVVGTGAEVKEGGAVVANYHGTLKATGTVFDSSFQRGEPIAFPLAGVITGWQKGVPGMKVGGLRRLTIPFAMAYGEQGRPPTIPPSSDLVFVIELVDTIVTEDVSEGAGEVVGPRFVAVTKHTIKTPDGKEVESTKDTPYVWIPGEMMGVDFGLVGMKVGGKRKITIPAKMAIAPQGLPTPTRPTDQTLICEIELIAVRNLPGR